jgi:hypothetical protein
MTDPSRSADQPYLAKLQAVAEGLKPGELRLIDVLHDDDCPRLRGGACGKAARHGPETYPAREVEKRYVLYPATRRRAG